MALRNLERHEEALASFNQAIALNPDDYDVWINHGIVKKKIILKKIKMVVEKKKKKGEQKWKI